MTDVADLASQAKALLSTGDSYALIELLDRQDPLAALEAYDAVQHSLYWDDKDLPAMIAVSRAGIQHGLTAGLRTTDSKAAAALRGKAKVLAYNLGSFTWPGWAEPGIKLSTSDIAVGVDAARLNLRLARELDRPAKAVANAYWLLGAQQIADRQFELAAQAFVIGQSHADDAGEPLVGRMLEGYIRLANVLATPGDQNLVELMEMTIEQLQANASPDAQEYARQLSTARQVFGIAPTA